LEELRVRHEAKRKELTAATQVLWALSSDEDRRELLRLLSDAEAVAGEIVMALSAMAGKYEVDVRDAGVARAYSRLTSLRLGLERPAEANPQLDDDEKRHWLAAGALYRDLHAERRERRSWVPRFGFPRWSRAK
jgi:hypothetical protein